MYRRILVPEVQKYYSMVSRVDFNYLSESFFSSRDAAWIEPSIKIQSDDCRHLLDFQMSAREK